MADSTVCHTTQYIIAKGMCSENYVKYTFRVDLAVKALSAAEIKGMMQVTRKLSSLCKC